MQSEEGLERSERVSAVIAGFRRVENETRKQYQRYGYYQETS